MDESTVSALTTVGKEKNVEPVEGSAALDQPEEAQNVVGGMEVDDNFDGSFHDDQGFDSGSELLPLQIEFTAKDPAKDKQASKSGRAANPAAFGKSSMDDESDIDFDESLEAVSSPVGDAPFKSPRSGRGAPKSRTETVRISLCLIISCCHAHGVRD